MSSALAPGGWCRSLTLKKRSPAGPGSPLYNLAGAAQLLSLLAVVLLELLPVDVDAAGVSFAAEAVVSVVVDLCSLSVVRPAPDGERLSVA